MTLMIRDEADVIAPMIEHHLSQGVDTIIATDNGSTDGTREILESFGDAIDLRHDPVHRKQQFSVVTGMARDAFTEHGADWVVNADADEFWLPARPGATLREVFEQLPRDLNSFIVPVIDMTGSPAQRGSGLQRLVYRDTRPLTRLHEIGLHAHSTPDAVHVGSPDVEVSQGNHAVNLEQTGAVPDGMELEVLHFPWRSWEQFEQKVVNAGRAYESNPDLQPSPNHHGMREYRRWKTGSLLAYYVLRHPDADELAEGEEAGTLVRDTRIAETRRGPVAEAPLDGRILDSATAYGPVVSAIERAAQDELNTKDARIAEILGYLDEAKHRIDGLIGEVESARESERLLRRRFNKTIEGAILRAGRAVERQVARPPQ